MANRIYDYQKVFEFIVQYKQDHDGNSPSVAEIGQAFGIQSNATVKHILDVLEGNGEIKQHGKARSIEVVGGHWSIVPTIEKGE